jgi:tRNA 2-thiouridine synthesizing protein A
MPMSLNDPLIVDARGHHCPVPTLRLRKALETALPGQVVQLLADDPMARIDAPHFCNEAGHDLIAVEADGAVLTITVRKRA